MELYLEKTRIEAVPGKSLRQLIVENGLDSRSLNERPLAARIAGETFTLNYIPLRESDIQDLTVRKAVAAAKGQVQLLRYRDPKGKRVYERTALFVLYQVLSGLYPTSQPRISCAVGPALFISMDGLDPFEDGVLESIRGGFARAVAEDFPFVRHRMDTQAAKERLEREGRTQQARLLQWRSLPYFDLYESHGYADYLYGEMLPSSGYLTLWGIEAAKGGLMLLLPDLENPEVLGHYEERPNFSAVFAQSERWCQLERCNCVADLNDLTESGGLRELIRVSEALHEKSFADIADRIVERGARAVMIAGPSSSGKTTSANRLAVQLRVHGKNPILMSLDDYYIDRCKLTPGPDGKYDLEHINAIDTDLFRLQLKALLAGERVNTPRFNFKTQRREESDRWVRLDEDTIILVEGLHGLNPELLPEGVDHNLVFRLYVSALLPLNLDDHSRIPTTFLRQMRRIVRDNATRGTNVEQTLSMWDSIRRGEDRWIFPFQENADVIFNTSLIYEIALLKDHVYPLLQSIGPECGCYDDARALMKVLNYVVSASCTDEVPPTSILREFIGGNTFYLKS